MVSSFISTSEATTSELCLHLPPQFPHISRSCLAWVIIMLIFLSAFLFSHQTDCWLPEQNLTVPWSCLNSMTAFLSLIGWSPSASLHPRPPFGFGLGWFYLTSEFLSYDTSLVSFPGLSESCFSQKLSVSLHSTQCVPFLLKVIFSSSVRNIPNYKIQLKYLLFRVAFLQLLWSSSKLPSFSQLLRTSFSLQYWLKHTVTLLLFHKYFFPYVSRFHIKISYKVRFLMPGTLVCYYVNKAKVRVQSRCTNGRRGSRSKLRKEVGVGSQEGGASGWWKTLWVSNRRAARIDLGKLGAHGKG